MPNWCRLFLMKSASVVLILSLILCNPGFAAESHVIRLRWVDVAQMIPGKQVSVLTVDGAAHKGRVRTVETDTIVFEKDRTPAVPRASVAEIRMTEYNGDGRRFGKMVGGITGLMFGLIGAAVIGMKEGSAHRTGDKVAAVTLAVGGLPLGMAGGYMLGRLADKEVTVIRIIE